MISAYYCYVYYKSAKFVMFRIFFMKIKTESTVVKLESRKTQIG